jgi:hypothetical protein
MGMSMEQKLSKKSAPATLTDCPERHDRTPGAVSTVDAEAVERIVARQREINAATTSLASLIEEVAREFSADE